jgi:hypothetical protein
MQHVEALKRLFPSPTRDEFTTGYVDHDETAALYSPFLKLWSKCLQQMFAGSPRAIGEYIACRASRHSFTQHVGSQLSSDVT